MTSLQQPAVKDHLVLITGESTTGKSMSLYPMKDDSGVMYLNCEAGKRLPFKNNFKRHTIIHPEQVYQAFELAEQDDSIHTIVIDTLTYLMNMYESVVVLTSSNTMKAWGDYAQFFKNLMQYYVAKSSKNVIILAHSSTIYDESSMAKQVCVPVKGALAKEGIESYFSTVISTKKVLLKDLKPNELLNVTPEDEELGIKYVFQTRITKDTINERMRGPVGMWSKDELYIDNNIAHVLKRLHEYYDED